MNVTKQLPRSFFDRDTLIVARARSEVMSLITFETLKRHQRWAERVYGERCRKLIHLVESSQPFKPENLVWIFRAWQKNRKNSYLGISKIKKATGMYFLPRDWYPNARGRRTRLLVSMMMLVPAMNYPDKHVIGISFSRDVTDEELLWTIAHEYKHYLQYVELGKFTKKSHEMEVEADKFANNFVNFENPNIRKWAKFPTLDAVWKARRRSEDTRKARAPRQG